MKTSQMTALVTGACGGIGQALVKQLVQQGASLHLTDRNEEALTKLQKQLTAVSTPGQVISVYPVDFNNNEEIDGLIDRLNQLEEPINVLVNNAGISRLELFENLHENDIEQMMHLNSVVPMKISNKLLPMLKRQPQARIVNIASTFGAIGFPGYSIYSASKHAIRGFSEALGRELADTNVRVGCFLPRATKTSINTSKVVELNQKLNVAMDTPEVVAQALVSFLESDRREQAMGWPEKFLVRANSVFPGLISYAIEKNLPIIKQYAT